MIDNQETGAVLVTGGAGFVGSYVVRDLLAAGERVLAFDLHPVGNALQGVVGPIREDGSLHLASGTVTDGWQLRHLCAEYGVDRIVHLASPLTQDVTENPLAGVRDVCEGTATVFEVARACGVRRVVWASSMAVFGARREYPPGPIANDAPHRPTSLYGSCKSLCEQMARTYHDERDLDSIGLRLAVVYGPGRLRGYMSFPSELIRQAAAGEPVEVPIADQAIYWQYVEDISALIVHCLGVPTPEGLVFNTDGDVRTFRDAGQILQELAPDTSMSFSREAVSDGHRALLEAPTSFDASELGRQIGYSRRFTFEDGVRTSFAVFRASAREKVGEVA